MRRGCRPARLRDLADSAFDGGAVSPGVGADGAWSGEGDYAAAGEALQFTLEEMGLTGEERDALFGEPVEGVREDADESGMRVTFTDPDTGEDLVTFEPEDRRAR